MAVPGRRSLAVVAVRGSGVLLPSRFVAGAVLAGVQLSSSVPSPSSVVAAVRVALVRSLRLAWWRASSRSASSNAQAIPFPNFLSDFCRAGCYTLEMTSDGELLRRYAESKSEDAFAELVQRHLGLVYAAALRQVNGDSHLAQDVAQLVFADLARKADRLLGREALAGWLYTGAHYAAAKAVRAERRRHTCEQEGHAMQELLTNSGSNPDWETLCPILATAMHQISDSDREVIV